MSEGTILGLIYLLVAIVSFFILLGIGVLIIYSIKKCINLIKKRATDKETELNNALYSRI